MRRFFHFIFGVVLLLLLILAGIAAARLSDVLWEYVLHVGPMLDREWVVAKMNRYHLEVLGGGGVIMLLALLYLLTGKKRQKDESVITFQNEGGSVTISTKALQDSLEHLGTEFAAVLDLRPRVAGAAETLGVVLDVKVRSGTQIPELCRLLQNRVRESIQGELGLMEVKAVRVNIREIVIPPPEKAKAQTSDEPVEWEASVRP